jgi:hypothetical protein
MPYPILFAIIGALTGLFVSQVSIHTNSPNINSFLFTQILLVAIFSFVWKKQSNVNIAKSLLVMGAILFGLTFWFTINDYHHIHRISPLLYFLLIQITVICTAFIQSWKSEKPHWVYSDLFENAWNNQFFLLFSALLTGGFLGVLALGTSLFDSIGIELSDFIWRKEVAPVIIATLVGAGIGIAREYGSLIFKIRSVFFAIFRVMAYLAAAIVILFTLSLPFSLDSLFQNKNTSLILLSVVAVSILLLNTLLDTSNNDDENKLPLWQNRIFSAQIILLPFLSVLSIYAISIRLLQYGAMPKRIIALTIAVLLTCYGLAYLYQLIRHKGNWINGLAVVNPPLAVLWVVALIALASPLIDPIRLSVNSQVARLQNNSVSPDQFDFYALKHRLGNQGRETIEDIRTWKDHPQFTLIEKYIDKRMRYGKTNRQLSITVIGEAPAKVEQLKSKFSEWRCNEKSPCFIKQMHIDKTGEKQVIVFSVDVINTKAELYIYKDNGWRLEKIFSELERNSPTRVIARGGLSKDYEAKLKTKKEAYLQKIKDISEALKNDKQKLTEPKYFDIEIGGVKLRQ